MLAVISLWCFFKKGTSIFRCRFRSLSIKSWSAINKRLIGYQQKVDRLSTKGWSAINKKQIPQTNNRIDNSRSVFICFPDYADISYIFLQFIFITFEWLCAENYNRHLYADYWNEETSNWSDILHSIFIGSCWYSCAIFITAGFAVIFLDLWKMECSFKDVFISQCF